MKYRLPELCATKAPAKGVSQRINPDAFDGLGVAMQSIELAASFGIAEIPPVGGVVARIREARLCN